MTSLIIQLLPLHGRGEGVATRISFALLTPLVLKTTHIDQLLGVVTSGSY